MDYQEAFRGVWATAAPAATAQAPARGSVDTSLIRERFNYDWAMSDPVEDLDTYWWWARSIRVDPDEVIADDGEGAIWSIPFTTDGTDEITFGTPVRVAETYVPIQAGEGQAATAAVRRRRQRVAASALERPSKPARSNPQAAAESAPANERNPMDATVLQALARQHGLDPDTATEDQVNAAVLAAQPTDEPETPSAETPAGEVEEVPAETPEPVAASTAAAGPVTVTVDQAVWDRTQRDAQAGAAAARAQQASQLDALADAAVRDGRIAPSSRDSWRSAIDPGERPDLAATARATAERDRLAGLATNRVPVSERGSNPDTTAPAAASLTRALAASGVNPNGRSGATTQEVIRRG